MKPRPLAVPLPMRAGAFIVPEAGLSATRAQHEPRRFKDQANKLDRRLRCVVPTIVSTDPDKPAVPQRARIKADPTRSCIVSAQTPIE